MIIIKTTNGDIFVNDDEMISLKHNRDTHTAVLVRKNPPALFDGDGLITRVETVVYLNKAQPAQWCDEGSAVRHLQKKIDAYRAETACKSEIIKTLKEKLRSLGSDCVQWVCYYHKDMPNELCEQMRNRGEEAKTYVNDDKDKDFAHEYMQNKKSPDELESDEITRLNEQVERLDQELREKDAKTQDLINKAESSSKWGEAYRQANERLMKRSLWQRIINKKTYLWPE